MAERQTRNVSLPPRQNAFVDELVSSGRYRTASEVVRDGLRLLEEAEHRRLLERWLCSSKSSDAVGLLSRLPPAMQQRARSHLHRLVGLAVEDVRRGRVVDGPSAMQGLRSELEGALGIE